MISFYVTYQLSAHFSDWPINLGIRATRGQICCPAFHASSASHRQTHRLAQPMLPSTTQRAAILLMVARYKFLIVHMHNQSLLTGLKHFER